MLGQDGFQSKAINEHVMAMGEMPGVCIAQRKDSQRERSGEAEMHLNLPDGTMMLGKDGGCMNEHMMGMGEMPGVCVASKQDNKRERNGEVQMHFNLPDGPSMQGKDPQHMAATDEQVQVNLPSNSEADKLVVG